MKRLLLLCSPDFQSPVLFANVLRLFALREGFFYHFEKLVKVERLGKRPDTVQLVVLLLCLESAYIGGANDDGDLVGFGSKTISSKTPSPPSGWSMRISSTSKLGFLSLMLSNADAPSFHM